MYTNKTKTKTETTQTKDTHLSPRPGPVKLPCASTVATVNAGSGPQFSTTNTPSLLPTVAGEATARFLDLALDGVSSLPLPPPSAPPACWLVCCVCFGGG